MEGLGTTRFNDVFLKIYPYDSTSKFQELENLIKHLYHISQTKKMRNFLYLKNSSKICLTDFLNISALNPIHPHKLAVKNIVMGCMVGF